MWQIIAVVPWCLCTIEVEWNVSSLRRLPVAYLQLYLERQTRKWNEFSRSILEHSGWQIPEIAGRSSYKYSRSIDPRISNSISINQQHSHSDLVQDVIKLRLKLQIFLKFSKNFQETEKKIRCNIDNWMIKTKCVKITHSGHWRHILDRYRL